MKTVELFESARNSALEIRRIEERTQDMLDRIGVQGHGYDVINITGTLDPMRKVDDLLDWEARAKEEIAECQKEIVSAYEIVAGIEKSGFEVSAQIISSYYLEARSMKSLCKKHELDEEEITAQIQMVFEYCDQRGLAKIKEIGRGRNYQ